MNWVQFLIDLGGMTTVFTGVNWLFFYRQNKRQKNAEAGQIEMKYADEIIMQYKRLIDEYMRLLCFRICDKRASLFDKDKDNKDKDEED